VVQTFLDFNTLTNCDQGDFDKGDFQWIRVPLFPSLGGNFFLLI